MIKQNPSLKDITVRELLKGNYNRDIRYVEMILPTSNLHNWHTDSIHAVAWCDNYDDDSEDNRRNGTPIFDYDESYFDDGPFSWFGPDIDIIYDCPVVDYEFMTAEDYEHTVLANSCVRVSDFGWDEEYGDNDCILMIELLWPNELKGEEERWPYERPKTNWTKANMLDMMQKLCVEWELDFTPQIEKCITNMQEDDIFAQFMEYTDDYRIGKFRDTAAYYEVSENALRKMCKPLPK